MGTAILRTVVKELNRNRFGTAVLAILLAAGTAFAMTGCSNKRPAGETEPVIGENGEGQNEYKIYKVNRAGDELVTVKYCDPSQDPQELATILTEQMRLSEEQTSESEGNVGVFGENDRISEIVVDNSVAVVKFSNYETHTSEREMLLRAALTMTLCQVDGISSIYMMVGEQPLTNPDQTAVGYLTERDFVSVVGKNVNNYTRNSYVLYFANEDGTKLLGKKIDITYSSTFSAEEYVVKSLIDGPGTEGLYPTLSPDTRLLSVSVKDGTCYVNFDESFLNQSTDVDAGVVVYSIVNTLTELPKIKQVRLTVNGSSDVTFKDKVSLDAPLERNLDYYGGLLEQ